MLSEQARLQKALDTVVSALEPTIGAPTAIGVPATCRRRALIRLADAVPVQATTNRTAAASDAPKILFCILQTPSCTTPPSIWTLAGPGTSVKGGGERGEPDPERPKPGGNGRASSLSLQGVWPPVPSWAATITGRVG